MPEGTRTAPACTLQAEPVDLFETLRAFPGGFAAIAEKSGVALPTLYEFAKAQHLRTPWKTIHKVAPVLGNTSDALAKLWEEAQRKATAARAKPRKPRKIR